MPVRRMTGMLIIKQMMKLSDRETMDMWSENIYRQWFTRRNRLPEGAAVFRKHFYRVP